MNYIAQLITDNKVIDKIEITEDSQKMAMRIFYELGHRKLLATDNYRIDIFENKD